MVVWCVVVGRWLNSSLSFHRVPKEEKRQLWLNVIKCKHWAPTNNDRVYGLHIISCFVMSSGSRYINIIDCKTYFNLCYGGAVSTSPCTGDWALQDAPMLNIYFT